MSRLNAAGLNFTERGQAWGHFWQDGGPDGPAGAVAPPGKSSEADQLARRNKQGGFVESAVNIALLALAAAVPLLAASPAAAALSHARPPRRGAPAGARRPCRHARAALSR